MKVNIHRIMAGIALGFVIVAAYTILNEELHFGLVENIPAICGFVGAATLSFAGLLGYFPQRLIPRIFFVLISAILLPFSGALFVAAFFVVSYDILYGVISLIGSFALCWTAIRMLAKTMPKNVVKNQGQDDDPKRNVKTKSIISRIGLEYKITLLAMLIFHIAALHFKLPDQIWGIRDTSFWLLALPIYPYCYWMDEAAYYYRMLNIDANFYRFLLWGTLFYGFNAFFITSLLMRRFRRVIKLIIGLLVFLVMYAVINDHLIIDGHCNEASALAGLKMLTSQEAVWRQQDADGNGLKDYWTFDISCFNRMYRHDGITKVGFIDISFARADGAPATDNAFSGHSVIEPWIGDTLDKEDFAVTLTSKSGYYFQAMWRDERGTPYQQDADGDGNWNTNPKKFAFCAYPAEYERSGINTFIVNEQGYVWSKDTGGLPVLQWPAKNPKTAGWAPGE